MGKFVSPDNDVMVVYGGTFDPFHRGHEAICHAILQYSFVKQLRFVPCHVSALKAGATVSGIQRLQMLELWKNSQSDRLVIDPIELSREGTSYTLDTVLVLQKAFPGTQIILAMGADAWQSLPQWHGYDDLRSLVNIWVFTRLGQDRVESMPGWSRVDRCRELKLSSPAHYFVDSSVRVAVSSTILRNGTESLETQVPNVVFNYILKNNLYHRAFQESQGS